jgi:hypothetical protein
MNLLIVLNFSKYVVFVLLSLLLFNQLVWAETVSDNAQILISDPELIKHALEDNSKNEEDFARQLHVGVDTNTRVWLKKNIPCDDFDTVSVDYVRLSKNGQQAVINAIANTACQQEYLIIFDKVGNSWRFLTTLLIPLKYNIPKLSYKSLVDANENEIVITGFEADTGSGIYQSNLLIWKLVDTELKLIFDEPLKIHFALPGDGKFDQKELSKFSFVKSRESGNYAILQEQVISTYKSSIARWRIYYWNAPFARFVAYSYSPKS